MLETGKFYRCIKDVVMEGAEGVPFKRGKVYRSVQEGSELPTLMGGFGRRYPVDVSGIFEEHFDPTPITPAEVGKTRGENVQLQQIKRLNQTETVEILQELREKYKGVAKKMTPTITEEALKLIGGDRQEAYGDVRTSFESIAKVWSGILKTDVSAEQVALMMVGLKLVRQSNKHKRDNLVDVIGYTILLARLEGEE